MSIAIATQTGPDDWSGQSDETIATVLELLAEQNERMRRGTRR